MTENEQARETTRKLVLEAATQYRAIPAHYKLMVKQYTDPMMAAILAINTELELLSQGEA